MKSLSFRYSFFSPIEWEIEPINFNSNSSNSKPHHRLQGLEYWERLSALKMYAQERRRERYQIIYVWKVSQLLVSGYTLQFQNSLRRGRLVELPPLPNGAPAADTSSRIKSEG